MARAAFLGAQKADILEDELNTDEFVQVDACGQDIAAGGGWIPAGLRDIELKPHLQQGLSREKGYLALVVGPMVEKTVSPDTASGNTFNRVHFDHGRCPGGFAMMAVIIVAR